MSSNYKTITQKIKIGLLERIKLETLSMEHRWLYNQLLSHAKTEGFNYKKLNSKYVELRHQENLTIPSKSAQNTCLSLISSFKSYLALKKIDKNARAPSRFKSHKHGFTSFEYDWNGGNGGFKIIGDKLILLRPRIEIPLSKYIINQLMNSKLRVIKFFGRDDDIYVAFLISCESPELKQNNKWLSIDLGLTKVITGVTSDAEIINIFNQPYKKLEKQTDVIRSKRDKKKKHSKRYIRLSATLKRKNKKLCNKRLNFQHKITKAIISTCIEKEISTLIVGDIQTKQLAKNCNHTGLNRSTQNRGTLGRIKSFLAYKANQVGIECILQNEAWTSRTNCLTGEIASKRPLSERSIELIPGLVIDRDVNGAINIANKHFQGQWLVQEGWLNQLSEIQLTIAV